MGASSKRLLFRRWQIRCRRGAHQPHAEGTYLTLNPVRPELLARANNRLESWAKHTTADEDVLCRRWLAIDVDAVRPSGIYATDEEHEAALELARSIREFLRELGWPDPIFANSGNGAHLLYRIDEPNDDATRELLRQALLALAMRFDDEVVKVDRTTFNAVRIWKLYGTLARKGDSLPERPHRPACILEVPEALTAVNRERFATLAAAAPQPENQQAAVERRGGERRFDLDTFFVRHPEIRVKRIEPYQGGRRIILEACVFNPDHTGTSAAIIEGADGKLGYACRHSSCADKHWHDAREKFEPGYRDRPAEKAAPIGRPASEIKPSNVDWLIQGLIPLGKPTLIAGGPGRGKSILTAHIAACVSTGAAWPGGRGCRQGHVLILSAEDGAASTIVPRLIAAGAELPKVRVVDVEDDLEALPDAISRLEATINADNIRLIVIDPLNSFLGENTNPHQDASVRRALKPLSALAARTGAALIVIFHLNKDGGRDGTPPIPSNRLDRLRRRVARVVLAGAKSYGPR